jgi:hypothetical protein
MKTKYDLSKASAVIDEYLRELADPNKIPGRIGRTWIEFCMQRNGMIPDVRNLGFGEAHALWYAALIVTKRLREVSRAERAAMPNQPFKTETTVRRMMKPHTFSHDSLTARYVRDILEALSTNESPRPA